MPVIYVCICPFNSVRRLQASRLTTWSRVLVQERPVPRLLNKFPVLYGKRRLITAFTAACDLSPVCAWLISLQPPITFQCYLPMYAWTFQLITSLQVYPSKRCKNLSFPPQLHILSPSNSSVHRPNNILLAIQDMNPIVIQFVYCVVFRGVNSLRSGPALHISVQECTFEEFIFKNTYVHVIELYIWKYARYEPLIRGTNFVVKCRVTFSTAGYIIFASLKHTFIPVLCIQNTLFQRRMYFF